MNFTFVQPPSFAAEWERLRLTDEDLQALERTINDDPDAGPVMRGTGGVRKLRFAPPSWNRGKSGATRVCYVAFIDLATVYLLALFPKNERSDLNAAERNFLRARVRVFRRFAEEGSTHG